MNTERLRQDLIRHEGLKTTVYLDSLGNETIGCGRNVDHRGGGITEAEALYLLDNDIARVQAELDHALPWWRSMDEVRQQVLANMSFNMGLATLLRFHNMLGALEHHNYDQAAQEMLDSRWAKQVGKRAVELAERMRTGQ